MNKIIFACLTTLLLVITSCSAGEGGSSSDGDYCYGADGVRMQFDTFSEREITGNLQIPVEIGLDFENLGPSLADITLDVRGIDSKGDNSIFEVSFIGGDNKFILQPRECDQEFGDDENVLVSVKVRDGLDLPSKSLRTKADIALCYQYDTVYDKPICIKGTESKTGRSGVCDPDNQIFIESYGQGSPVVVSNIEYTSSIGRDKAKHTYKISFEKGRTKWNGNELRIFPPQSNLCGDKESDFDERKSRNKIEIKEVKLGLDVLNCNVEEVGIFEIEKQPLTCWIELSNSDSIVRPLYIKASYEVEDSITKDSIKFDLS